MRRSMRKPAEQKPRSIKLRDFRISRFEVLEARRLLAADNWTGSAGDGLWMTAGNWSNGVPVSGETVNITISNPGTITISGGAAVAGSLNDQTAPLNIISGASLSLTSAAATSTLGQSVTVGGALSMAADASLVLPGTFNATNTLSIQGSANFAAGDKVTLDATPFASTTQIVVTGTLTATGTSFLHTGTYTTNLTVNSGGQLVPSGDTFGVTLYLPARNIASLSAASGGSDNQSFQDIEVQAGTLTSGTLNLGLIGADTTKLRYVFPAGFTVPIGASLNVASNVPVLLPANTTLAVAGSVSFASGDTVTLDATPYASVTQIAVTGSLTATGTSFLQTGSYTANLTVVPGGQLVSSGDTFGLTLNLPASNIASLSAAGGGSDNQSFQDIDLQAGTLTSGSLDLGLIGADTTKLRYVFPAGFTVPIGTSLNVAAGVPMLLPSNKTLAVAGSASFAARDTVTLDNSLYNPSAPTQISVTGSLTATGTSFVQTGSYASQLVVAAGGQLLASDDSFGLTLKLPASNIASLSAAGGGSDNQSFQDIDLQAGTLTSGTLDLGLIGDDTTKLRYVFPTGFTVPVGASLNVAPNVPVLLPSNTTLAVAGSASFASGDRVTLDDSLYNPSAPTQISVTGSLTATGTSFVQTGSYASQLVVAAGGQLLASDDSFGLTLNLPASNIALLSAAGGGSDNQSFQDIDLEAGTLTSGNLNLGLIGADTTKLRYVFPAGFTVPVGASLNVASDVPVLLPSNTTLAVAGSASFASGDTVTLDDSLYNPSAPTQISVTGSLTATGTSFVQTGSYASQLVVAPGGQLVPSGDTFSLPLSLPASNIALLSAAGGGSDNHSFQDIDLQAGTLTSGILNLGLIGADTTKLRYVFPAGFTVPVGASLNVASNVPVFLPANQTLAIKGSAIFAEGDTVTLASAFSPSTQITVDGRLSAAGTSFVQTGSYSAAATINSGGLLSLSNSNFGVGQLNLANSSIDTLTTNILSSSTTLTINSGATLSITANDFTNVGTSSIVAVGDPSSTIELINNYWGTTNPAAIAGKILDHADDATRPTVAYTPFLSLRVDAVGAQSTTALFSNSAQNLAISAAVIGPYGTISEGTVTFTLLNGATTVGSPITANVTNGAAAVTYLLPAATPIGTYTIQAAYSGSANYSPSTDASHVLTLGEGASVTAADSVTANFNTADQTVTLDATVTTSGNPINEGTETFTILSGTTVIGNPVTTNVVAGGATVLFTLPGGTAPATYTIDAAYNGTAKFLPSSDMSHTLIVNPATTITTAANAATDYNRASQVVSLSATVTSPAGGVNEGTETFTVKNGATVIGTPVTVNVSAGAADANYTLPAGTLPGTYVIEADYDGTANFVVVSDTSHHLTVSPPPAAAVSVRLDAGSDSGAPNHPGYTNVTAPTFDVQVNQTGSITIDFDGNPADDQTLAVAAAGTYQFTAPTLAAGDYTATASFDAGVAGTDQSRASFTIETAGPSVGSMLPTGTIAVSASQVTVTFSQPVDLNTFIPSAITLTGPGGAISVNQPQLVSGSTYTIGFATQITDGDYSLTIAPTVTDFAGNLMDQNLNGVGGEAGDSFSGSFTMSLPVGGPIALNTPTFGFVPANQVDDWTFFGRAGQTITTVVATSDVENVPPPLDDAQVTLLDPNNNVLGTTSNATSGAVAKLSDITLAADGTYHVHVAAPAAHAGDTGFYDITVADATVHQMPLAVNEVVTGKLLDAYSTDQWVFTATANQQVQFKLVNVANSDLEFDLTGPSGYTAFSGATASSAPIDLPSTGTYTITVHTSGSPGAYALELVQNSVIGLTLNTPHTATLAGSGQQQLYSVTIAAANPLEFNLTDANPQDQNEIYVSFGKPPTRDHYDYRFTGGAAANHTVVLSAQPGTYYALVYNSLVKTAGSYTIEAESAPFLLSGMTPQKVGNAFANTLELSGVFPLATQGGGYVLSTAPYLQLVASDGSVVPGVSVPLSPPPFGTVGSSGGVNPDGTMTVSAVLPGGVVLPGVYSVRVTDSSGASQTLADVLTVVAGGLGILKTNVVVPNPIGFHESSTIYVQYTNVGNAPMAAPLLVLTATQDGIEGALLTLDKSKVVSGFWTSATPDGYAQSVQFLASGAVPGVLQPGESESVPVYYAGWLHNLWDFSRPPIDFSLGVLDTSNTQAVDWASLKNSLKPASINQDAWNALFPNLTTQLGATWGDYVQRLDTDAQYLAGLGETVTDIGQLFNFEVQQANGYSPLSSLASATDAQVAAPGLPLSFARTFAPGIIARNQFGRFGWGWSDSWDTSLTVDADGSVNVLGPNGALRRFQPDSRGGYFDQPGDHGTLAARSGGGYTLTELNGQVTAYNADGSLNYVLDTNGNGILASYTGGLLTKLTHSSGQFLKLTYNTAGLVSTITDSAGRTTTYDYDPTNHYLTSVVDFDGQTTSYSYDTGSNPATAHALLSVTHSDGSHDDFSYDAQGRLADAHRDGGAEDTTFAYMEGQVAVSDALNDTTSYFFDNRGLMVEVENPLQNTVHYAFDSNLNLVLTTDAAGQVYKNTYDNYGNLLTATDPLGNTVSYVYQCDDDRLAAVTDGKGNTTTYGYDGKGDLTSTTNADGTVESVAYDPVGNVLSSTDRMGQATHYTHDAAGNILTETFADGSQVVFTYDTHENLTSATDSTGTTTLSYDTNDRLIKITYPSGRYLSYSYDDAGRRTQMVDQTGFTVNYSYDDLGHLSTLTDGSGNLIVKYSYDTVGRLSREDHGNGTYVTYEYDAAGELLHLINYAPDGTVNSRFDYTYDSLGRRITEATLDGSWTYSYDAIGELTHAVFVSSNPDITNQDLAYSYDAAGNRTQTVINGVTTAYVTNNLNEYTSVGGVAYTYNADGDLTSDGTNTYAFNDQNQLVGVTEPGGSWTYQYDAFGNRASMTQNGQTTQYLVDPSGLGNVVSTYNVGGALVDHYTYGLGLVSQVDTSNVGSYYDFDAIGSTAGITGANGSYLNTYAYLPFGETLSTTGSLANPFQYAGTTGVMYDENGLQYMRARFYEPPTGRFTTTDPLKSDTNLYGYAHNNAVSFSDPSGDFVVVLIIILDISIEEGAALATADIAAPTALEALTDAYWEFASGVNQILASGTIGEAVEAIGSIWSGAPWLTKLGALVTTAGAAAFPWIDGSGQVSQDYEILELSDTIHEVLDIAKEDLEILKRLLDDAVNSVDPNSKIGPVAYGAQHFVSALNALPYKVNFENDPTASAPAQRVDVTDQLDPNLDWSTFQWTGFGFGDNVIAVPPNTQHYQATLPMTYNGVTFRVVVTLDFDPAAGTVHASFQSLNAATLMTGLAICPGTLSLGPADPFADLPPDVTIGFLPPEDGTGRGMGYLTYSVRALAGDATGTQIRNVANVTFDQGNTIATDQVSETDPTQGVDPAKQALVTIDAVAPTSTVAALPATSPTNSFTVDWSGTDDAGGSGISSYSIYVSDNGGPFKPWLIATTQTSATYAGMNGHAYGFFSLATDNAGNQEAAPSAAQASTTIQQNLPTIAWSKPAGITYGDALGALQLDATASASGNALPGTFSYTLADGTTPADGAVLNAGQNQALDVTFTPTDSTDYATVIAQVQITVDPAVLTVKANDASRVYGAANPSFSDTISGFVNGDGPSAVSGAASLSSTATATSAVGGYPITPALGTLSAANYTFAFENGTLTVTQAAPVVVWSDPADIVYGNALGAAQLDATATVSGNALPGTFSYTLADGSTAAAGAVLSAGQNQTIRLTFKPTDAADYFSVITQVAINVGQATLTVKANDTSKAFGTPNPALTDTITGFVNGDATSVVTGAASLSTTATTSSLAGAYPITAAIGTLSAANYTFAFQNGTLTVTAAAPVVTWSEPADITYGTALGATQLDATAAVSGNTVPGTFTYTLADGTTAAPGAVLKAGQNQTLNVTFTPTDTTDYTTTTGQVTITVDPATLTVAANDASKVYQTANPAFSDTISGFVNGDGLSVVSGAASLTTTATTTSGVGVYPITAARGTLSAANYTFTFDSGTLTVTQATPGITWSNPADIVYGNALGATQLDATASVPGTFSYALADGTTPASGAVLSAGRNQTLDVTFTPNDKTDYRAATGQVTLNVNAATLTVKANNASKGYGAAIPTFTDTISGFVNGDSLSAVSGAANLTTTASIASPAGSYPITAALGSLNAANYTFTFQSGTLTVTPATPVVTWTSPADIVYGTALGAAQLDATANVPGGLSYTLSDGTTPASGAVLAAGQNQKLNVTFTPIDAADYAAVARQVEINVDPATLTVKADNASKVHGTANPMFTDTITGFVNGDGPGVVSGAASLTTTATSTSPAGDYAIATAPGTLSAANYVFSFQPGTLTVTRATPSVAWTGPADIVYGTPLTAAQLDATASVPGTFTYTLANGTKPAAGTVLLAGPNQTLNVTFTPTDSTDYTTAAGQVAINVDRATLKVTANDASRAYGAANPAFTATITGFVNGDNTGAVSGAPSFATTATTNSTAGNYPIVVGLGTWSAANYTFVFQSGTLTVAPAAPNVTWANPSAITYGAALGGTQLDAAANVPGTFRYTLSDGKTAAGGAVLHAGKNQILNATFTPTDTIDYRPSTSQVEISVEPAKLTVKASDASKVFGTANPSFTNSITGFVNGDGQGVVSGGAVLSTTATTASAVGSYPITAVLGTLNAADYTFAFENGTLTVKQATPAITWSSPAGITYGAALGATQLDAKADVPGTFRYTLADGTTPAGGAVLHVGRNQTLNVAFTPSDPTDYKAAAGQTQIDVGAATLTVKANDASKVYGAANPSFTGTVSGFVNGDGAGVVSGAASFSTPATASSAAGSYAITPNAGTLAAADYTFAFQNGTLTVTPATPVITWNDPADIKYGVALGLAQLDAIANVPGTFRYTLADGTTPANGVVLHAGQHQTLKVTFTPTDATDYTAVTGNVAINVDPATLTVKANDASRAYGVANPALTDTISGFVNGDDGRAVSGAASLTTTATTTSAAGGYPIAVAKGTLGATDYSFVFQNGTLTVTQAMPILTWANPADITYGAALGATQLDATASVPGSFSYTLANGTTSASGAILPAGQDQTLKVTFTPTDATDYTALTAQAKINVAPATLTVKANDADRDYGAANPTFTDTISGFVNGDGPGVVSGVASLTTTAASTSPPGTYPIAAAKGTLSAADYTFAFQNGTLTVTQTQLTGFSAVIAAGSTVSGTVASFSDPNPGDNANDFGATIDWGDGQTGTGHIAAAGAAGQFNVTGGHSYADNSPHTIAVTVTHGAGQPLVVTSVEPGQTINLLGTFGVVQDVYVIGSGTVTVAAANGVLANDSASGPLTVTTGTVAGANGGSFVFHIDGSFTYTPPAKFPGYDYVQYAASDAQGDHATATVNLLSQTGGVVWKFYEQVLDRSPDVSPAGSASPSGLQYWINDFVNGGKTGDIAVGFFESDELLDTILGGYYQQYLGRTLDPNGLAYWKGVWHATGGPEGIKAGFADSPEFNANAGNAGGGNPAGWLTALYQRILNRAPDPQGLQYWKQQLAGGDSEYNVALGFFESLEAYQNDVTGWIQEYLGRAPTPAELQQYANEMKSGTTDRQIEQQITNLPEYGQHPPASPAGTAVRLPDYYPQPAAASQQAAIAARDSVFSQLGR